MGDKKTFLNMGDKVTGSREGDSSDNEINKVNTAIDEKPIWNKDGDNELVITMMCNVINNNSWTLYKNIPWSKVSSFKLRVKLKMNFWYIRKVQVPFFVQVHHKNCKKLNSSLIV